MSQVHWIEVTNLNHRGSIFLKIFISNCFLYTLFLFYFLKIKSWYYMRRRRLFSLLCFSLRRTGFLFSFDRRGLWPRCIMLIIFVNFHIHFNLRFWVRPFICYFTFLSYVSCAMDRGYKPRPSWIILNVFYVLKNYYLTVFCIRCFYFTFSK